MREDTGSKGDLLVQVAFGETIPAELELRRNMRTEIGVQNTEGVEVGDMVSSYLVRADE